MNNLRYFRAESGLTQSELAKKVGVSRVAIHNAEEGVISVKLAKKCAEVLELNAFHILGQDSLALIPKTKEDMQCLMGILADIQKGSLLTKWPEN